MIVSQKLREIWNFFWFTDQVFVRDIFIRRWEVDFKFVPPRAHQKLVKKLSLPNTTLPVELGNGFIRKRERWHHSMSERATWQALAASPVLTDFDLKRPTATLASVTQRMKAIPKTTYSAVGWENSLGVDYDALSGDATWDNVSWEHRRLCFQSFRQLVEEHGGDWKKLGNSFGSSFGVRKTYLYSDHPDLAGQVRPCDFKGYVLPAGP